MPKPTKNTKPGTVSITMGQRLKLELVVDAHGVAGASREFGMSAGTLVRILKGGRVRPNTRVVLDLRLREATEKLQHKEPK